MSCEYAYIFNRTTKTCSGIVIDHTKINRPYPRPRPQINSSLRRFDWRKKQFPVHHGEHHLVHHVETVGFAVVVGQEVSFIQFISILPVENKKKPKKGLTPITIRMVSSAILVSVVEDRRCERSRIGRSVV